MADFHGSFLYLPLDEAAAELGMQPRRLMHAGCIGDVQICINAYARAHNVTMRRLRFDNGMDLTPHESETEDAEALLTMTPAELAAEKRAAVERDEWAKNAQEMPAGVYQIDENTLRHFEMAGTQTVEVHEGIKKNDMGWWNVEFLDPLIVTYADLILLKSKIDGLKKRIEEPSAAVAERPLGTRERNTLLAIIAALCQHSGLDVRRHAKSAAVIQSAAEMMGLSLAESTIEAHLKKIPWALESRIK